MLPDRIMRVLQAAVVGDAFGVPYEFKERESYTVEAEMIGGGFWEQAAGTWSDDTAFTLALIDNLTQDGSYADLMDKFVAYMERGAYTPTGQLFDIGNTCAKAIRTYVIEQAEPTTCGDPSEFANGNGALMRLAPLAIALYDEPAFNRRAKKYCAYTQLTHRHPRAVLGSIIYLETLWQLLHGKTLSQALAAVNLSFEALPAAEQAEIPVYHRLFATNFKKLPVSAIKSSGYVVDTLEAAVWVAANARDLKSGIMSAAALGQDTDTIATIAASLMVASGRDVIPPDWWQAIVNHELAESCITPFAEKFGNMAEPIEGNK
ncbi:ADP-ribosylglycohydrolase [Lacticaseibacillus zeae DSM 20178 = KCTC 3804]|jgi:ADP-ribosylglycohydrolase|uniref:ADP-ribosylglycohydrolase n=2 Tax=Lacticaseibacillus zeae TaxID=57037 RepID=A0A5R8LW67_LACZE|nr:ADP-ribosylglycohydrolase family protein [Lacticaseibacillus zeae]KRK13094.1 ADP-ribosylglycohydrolase [Lacticaseibacillus zeae DSM 20178 = KCTC 3804]OLS06838.1 ADP-ribosylglycohydrolase [Lacticaseibacillus casei]QVI31924.1 ADP-ribosylglycohydrolase family protein [Lacticaseibacillus zeae]TLF41508.1 ADP-ribosylglycohydrolase [Lacticaseibacillus zeae]